MNDSIIDGEQLPETLRPHFGNGKNFSDDHVPAPYDPHSRLYEDYSDAHGLLLMEDGQPNTWMHALHPMEVRD